MLKSQEKNDTIKTEEPWYALIDIDDTLIDFSRAERMAVADTAAHFGVEEDRLAEVFHRVNDHIWQELECGKITRPQLGELRALRVFEGMQWNNPPEPLVFDRYYRGCLSKVHPLFDGALDFLETLSQDACVCLVSNATVRVQIPRLQNSGIFDRVRIVFLSEIIGYEKPDRRYFDYVEAFLPNLNPSRTVLIGNSLTADIAGALRAGYHSILFDAHHLVPPQENTAEAYADCYAQVLEIVRRMQNR